MERLLDNDLAAKVLSLVLAFLLWLRVSGEMPPVQKQVTGVPVRVVNVPPGMAVVSVEPEVVTVYVHGRGRALERASRGELAAVVDLRGAPPGRTVYSLENVNLPRGLTLVDVRPSEVVIALEQLGERAVPVVVRVQGRPAPGFSAGSWVAEPREVSARGLRRAVERVRAASAEVSVDGAAGDVEVERPVRAVDGAGQPVPGVEVVPPRVTVRVPVARQEASAAPAPQGGTVTGGGSPGYVIVQGGAEVSGPAGGAGAPFAR